MGASNCVGPKACVAENTSGEFGSRVIHILHMPVLLESVQETAPCAAWTGLMLLYVTFHHCTR